MKSLFKLSLLSAGILAGFPLSDVKAQKVGEVLPASTKQRIAAVVNGEKIMFDDVWQALQGRFPRLEAQTVDSKILNRIFNQFLDSFVALKLLSQEAKSQGISNDVVYKKAMEFLGNQKMAEIFLDRVCKERVTLASIQKAFDEMPLQDKKIIRYRTIFVDKKSVADQVMNALKIGKTSFEDIAKKHSQDTNPGTIHETLEIFLSPDLVKSVRTLKVKNHTSPILTKGTRVVGGGRREEVEGWVIVYLEERRNAQRDEMKDILENILLQRAQGEVMLELKGKAKIELFDYNGKPRQPLEESATSTKKNISAANSGTSLIPSPKGK